MTIEEKRMIPLSVIDAKIARLKDITPSTKGMFSQKELILSILMNLEEMKKEAIPSPSPEICEFIGCKNKPCNHTLKQFGHFLTEVHTCNDHNLELHNTWVEEQKINARIAELEIDNNYCYECGIDYQNYARDELRKLLS